jgi:hypothetical protein
MPVFFVDFSSIFRRFFIDYSSIFRRFFVDFPSIFVDFSSIFRRFFVTFFVENIFKNHNIGPQERRVMMQAMVPSQSASASSLMGNTLYNLTI